MRTLLIASMFPIFNDDILRIMLSAADCVASADNFDPIHFPPFEDIPPPNTPASRSPSPSSLLPTAPTASETVDFAAETASTAFAFAALAIPETIGRRPEAATFDVVTAAFPPLPIRPKAAPTPVASTPKIRPFQAIPSLLPSL